MERGDPNWHTRSTSPMSMPSSSEAVATSTFSSPRLSLCSASSRNSLARLPWWAATCCLPSNSPRWRAARSAMRRVLTNTRVVACCSTSRNTRSTATPLLVDITGASGTVAARAQGRAADVAHVDDGAVRVRGAGQEVRDGFDRLLGGRQAHPRGAAAHQGIQPLQRERQVAAPLAPHQGVDLVHDHRAHAAQHAPSGLGAQQHIQRFRGGHQDVGGAPAQGRALGLGSIASADGGADPDIRKRPRCELVANPRQRRLEVDVDVVRERLQRRDVQHQGGVGQAEGEALPHQRVDGGQERGECLSGAGGRRHQGIAAAGDRGPRADLGRGGRSELRANQPATAGWNAASAGCTAYPDYPPLRARPPR